MNSSIKGAAKFAEELNQSNENSNTKGRYLTLKSKITTCPKEKMVKQSNA